MLYMALFVSTCGKKKESSSSSALVPVQSPTKKKISFQLIFSVFCFFFPVMSSLVKYWLTRPQTQLSCVCLLVCATVFNSVQNRDIRDGETQSERVNMTVSCDLIPPLASRMHVRAHTHTLPLILLHALPSPSRWAVTDGVNSLPVPLFPTLLEIKSSTPLVC